MLIKNGTVHNGLGEILKTDIRIEEGKIKAMEVALEPMEGEEVFDAANMQVLPGFVQAVSSWGVNGGMQEIRPSSNDNDEKNDPILPEMDAFYAFNGIGSSNQQLCAFGLTTVGVAPTDNNLFGGSMAVFHTEGVNPYKLCLKRGVGMMASVSGNVKNTYKAKRAPQTRMWVFGTFETQLKKAAEYKEEEGKTPDVKMAALKKVIDGEMPLFVSCDSALAAERVHEIVKGYPNLKLVLVNGFDLKASMEWISEEKIPVLARTAEAVMDADAMKLDLKEIVKIVEKGGIAAMSGGYTNTMGAREAMLWNGTELMRLIHDSAKVLPMLTSIPAKILGVDDQVGSLKVGNRADIVIWSADPLKKWSAEVIRTYQDGEVVYRKGDAIKCM